MLISIAFFCSISLQWCSNMSPRMKKIPDNEIEVIIISDNLTKSRMYRKDRITNVSPRNLMILFDSLNSSVANRNLMTFALLLNSLSISGVLIGNYTFRF